MSSKLNTLLLLLLLCLPGAVFSQRKMEKLNRGVVATVQPDGKIFVSWRLFGNDPESIAFNLYRTTAQGVALKLNEKPLDGPTWFLDEKADLTQANSYSVRAVINNREQAVGGTFLLQANYAKAYRSIPLRTPEGYSANDCSAADLDGDGEYEIVVHMTGKAIDNAFNGFSSEPVFQAYKLDGTFLWEINLGKNIREGAHYTQFMVYDLDGDGKAEMVCKTADGTKDGTGKILGDPTADWREKGDKLLPTRDRTGSSLDSTGKMVAKTDGRIMSGPEFLTVFEGSTGKALSTVNYLPPLGTVESWGDAYANRSERYLACVAYLDGVLPSVVMCRGYYARTALAAWDFRNGKLTLRWLFDTHENPALKDYMGQGNHNLTVTDVDNDGKDEIVYGAACINDDGTGLYSTQLRHGDALHVGDLDPERPGLEVFSPHETPSLIAGAEFRDARTGELIWGKPSRGDNGRGAAFDIDPRYAGSECWSSANRPLFNAKGDSISEKPRSANFAIWWDGDLLRELLNGNSISKWDWEKGAENPLFVAEGCSSNNGSKSTPALSADLFGDWREELVLRTNDNSELRIFTTSIPTEHRIYTLMHDPQYRLSIAWQNVAYNQPPHVSFYLGHGMKKLPRPNITTE